MLSIGAMKGGQQNYYLELAREDYYLNGGEPPGLWHGQGAGDLGLSGVVEREALTRLFEGFHPTDDRSLIQQQHYEEGSGRAHRPGWDLTFSAPKSVSVLWSQADDATRRIIQEAHLRAVKAALDYLEDEVAVTRSGRGGRERQAARLVIATFEHHTSRAQNPQLHTHALVLNACTDAGGATRSVESRPFYRAKMAVGAVYRADFAAQLERRAGLEIERKGNLFEIAGVSPRLSAEMSQRKGEIDAAMAAGGFHGAAAAAMMALCTRQAKGHVAQEELTKLWQEQGEACGWGPEQAARLVKPECRPEAGAPQRNALHEKTEALRRAGERATEQQSYFSRLEFTRYLAEECPGRGLGGGELRAARDVYLSQSPEIVRLGRFKGEFCYTTRAMMEEERALLGAVERSQQAKRAGVAPPTVEGIIATRRQFSDEQAAALRHITGQGGGLRVVSGIAGSGKTTLLHAARLTWELGGFEVHGAALGGQAAEGLAEGSGIKSETLRRTLWDIQHGKLKLHEKSVVVIDEAGMVGTRMMRQLVDAVEQRGALLVLTGEGRQIQPIEAGGPLGEIERRVGRAQLTEIRRQREAWAREAVKDFAEGKAATGLRAYAERGLLTVEADRHGAMEALIAAWKERGLRCPEEQLILVGTRHEAAILNRMAQSERLQAGQIRGAGVAIPDSNETLYKGDRVLFTKKSRLYGVQNGSQGEVIRADSAKGHLAVRLDNGERVELAVANYPHVRPGYAMTTHKGQGATTGYAFILAGGSMQDREISYVQMSRARHETRLFTDVNEAGESLTRLARQMSTSRQKEMAYTVEARSTGARHEPGTMKVTNQKVTNQRPTRDQQAPDFGL